MSNIENLPIRFAVSLHPEIFYALQVLSDDQSRIHPRWKSLAQTRMPKRWQAIAVPSGLWPAVADIVDIAPTEDFSTLLSAFATVSPRQLQERLLVGLLHSREAAHSLLDDGRDIRVVIGSLPRAKRDWLAHVGMYPISPAAEVALLKLVDEPEQFQAGILQTLQNFWDAIFSETWNELRPALKASVAEKSKLPETCTFPELMRHTLLPIECDEKKQELRAIRGGAVMPISDITMCTFTPSVFNDARFWTVSADDPGSPWFPYFTPDIAPCVENQTVESAEPAPDIALIFRALGDSTRFAIASLIGRKPLTAVELAKTLSVSKPTVSHHVHVLRSAGLINETSHGSSVLISLRKPVLDQLSELAVRKLLDSRGPVEISKSRKQS